MVNDRRECSQRKFKAKVSLPILSLGLTSVRRIINNYEKDNARPNCNELCEEIQYASSEIVEYDPEIEECYDDFPFEQSKGQVSKCLLKKLALNLNRCIPSVSFENFGVFIVVISVLAPRMLSYLLLYPLCRLVFGTLYPAYASYKAVRTKNLKEYVSFYVSVYIFLYIV